MNQSVQFLGIPATLNFLSNRVILVPHEEAPDGVSLDQEYRTAVNTTERFQRRVQNSATVSWL